MPSSIKSLFKIGIAIATMNFSAPSVRAEVDPATYILRETTPQLLEPIIKVTDPNFKEMKDGKGYIFKSEGNTVVVFIETTKIRLGASFKGKRVNPTRVNEWNRYHGPARAYLVDDGAAVALAHEIELKHGVTLMTYTSFMVNFLVDVQKFVSFMKEE